MIPEITAEGFAWMFLSALVILAAFRLLWKALEHYIDRGWRR